MLDDKAMIRPPLRTRLAASRRTWKLPFWFTSTMREKSSSLMAWNGARRMIPALLTTTSTPPKARSVSSNSLRTAAASLTSACTQMARPPAASMSRTTAAARSRFFSQLTVTA